MVFETFRTLQINYNVRFLDGMQQIDVRLANLEEAEMRLNMSSNALKESTDLLEMALANVSTNMQLILGALNHLAIQVQNSSLDIVLQEYFALGQTMILLLMLFCWFHKLLQSKGIKMQPKLKPNNSSLEKHVRKVRKQL